MKVTIEDSPSGIILKVVPRIEDLAGADAGTLKVEKALEDEIKKHEKQALVTAVSEMKALLNKIPDDQIVRAIRESRDQR
jgi:hypothetical protein